MVVGYSEKQNTDQDLTPFFSPSTKKYLSGFEQYPVVVKSFLSVISHMRRIRGI